MDWRAHITTDPAGRTVVRGTGLLVDHLLSLLTNGWAIEQILNEYPGLTAEAVEACRAWARAQRALARRQSMTLRRVELDDTTDPEPIHGADAITLLTRLTRESWHLAGLPWPTYTRAETPYRFVPDLS